VSEPRTTADIMADLLEFAERHEWSDLIHTGGDYHEKGCRDCGATEDVRVKGHLCGEHAPDCNRWRLLEEARAFIRVERSTAAPAHTDGDACPSCSEVLGSPSVCAISHDFRPGAYDGATVTTTPGHTWRRDASGGPTLVPVRPSARPVLDQVYAIVRPFYETDEHAEGRPAASWVLEQVREAITTPVDVPHDLRLDKLSRFAGADAATKPGASCPDCHEDCIGWVVDGNQCGGAP